MTHTERTICIGVAFDSRARSLLMAVLRDFGGQIKDQNYGVGGSQELESVTVNIGGKILRIEAETYVGLSLRGEETLVEEIAKRVQEEFAKRA